MDVNFIKSIVDSPVLAEHKSKPVVHSSSQEKHSIFIVPGKVDSEAVDSEGEGDRLKKVVENVNKFIEAINSHLNFSIDEATKRVVVKVIDDNSNEVIREIPPKEMLELAAKFDEINALLFSSKV